MEDQTRRGAEVSAENVLQFNVAVLRLFGGWPPEGSRDHAWARLYTLYTASIFLSQVACIAIGLYHICWSWGDSTVVILTLVNTITMVDAAVKVAHLSLHAGDYRRLVAATRALIAAQWPACQRDEALMAIFRRCYRKALRLSIAMTTYINVVAPIWYAAPVIAWATGGEQRQLPFVNLQGAAKEYLSLYIFLYLLQCLPIVFWSYVSPCLDTLFVTCMLHAAAQLDILNARLTKVGAVRVEDGEETVALHIRRKIRNFAQHSFEADNLEELRNCIKIHQHILSFLQVLQRGMSLVGMSQFLCNSVSICLNLFQATCSPEVNSSVKCLMYFPMPAFHIFIYCYGGHELIDKECMFRLARNSAVGCGLKGGNHINKSEAEGLDVSLAAYSCAWIGATRKVTSSLQIIMCRAQKPLLLTAGKLYPINRLTFVSLMNASYSFYALLRQTRDR